MTRFALLAAVIASPVLGQTTQPKVYTRIQTNTDDNVTIFNSDNVAKAYSFAIAPMEKSNFLGVGTASAGAAMSAQFKLPKGSGLVVESVEKDSPADKAGLKQYDLIARIDDQVLFNTEQLRSLLRSKDENAQITLHVIRAGEKVEAKATLAMREQPANMFQDSFAPPAMGSMPAIAALRAIPGSRTRIIRRDDDKQIILNRDGTEPVKLIVLGGDDKQIFSGELVNLDDLSGVPAEYREQVKSALESVKLDGPSTQPTPPSAPKR